MQEEKTISGKIRWQSAGFFVILQPEKRKVKRKNVVTVGIPLSDIAGIL